MFVSIVLDEWRKKFDYSGRNNNAFSQNSSEWEEFIDRQRTIWTPSHRFEKCCPLWLAYGKRHFSFHQMGNIDSGNYWRQQEQRNNGNDEWPKCIGNCQKLHPNITLFFDSEKQVTVAVISHRLDPFTSYLDGQVDQGVAIRKTALYYELDGYIRENLTKMKQHEGFGSHLVNVAVGALESSDQSQQMQLKIMSKLKRHSQSSDRFGQLEEVLEICRLHRLSDDLDVFSIYCMRRSSKVLGKIAARIAKQRMKETKLIISPLVDGYALSGFSVFQRSVESSTTLQTEYGRLVDYASCNDIICTSNSTTKKDNNDCNIFLPVQKDKGEFSWECEELSLANLEREYIAAPEYSGQKLIVSWRVSDVDVPTGEDNYTANPSGCYDLLLGSLKIEACPVHGINTWQIPRLDLKLDVVRCRNEQVDDVTTRYSGNVRIIHAQIDFICLVRAYARCLESKLHARRSKIEQTRPLLETEEAYVREVLEAISMIV